MAIVIDPCALPLPGSGKIEYTLLTAVDTASYIEAVHGTTYNQQSAILTTWQTLPYTPGSGTFSEDQADTSQGEYYRLAIAAFVPGDTPAIRGEFQTLLRHRFLLRLTKGDQVLLVGTLERPLRLETKFDSGGEGGDNRGHRVTFTGVALQKSPGFVPVF
jgi:hypothetical protein